MKIKLDFVTNSSSSSFLLIVEKNYFDEMLAKEHPYIQAVANALKKDKKVLGIDAIIIKTMEQEDSSTVEDLSFAYEGELPVVSGLIMTNERAFARIQNILKDDSKVFSYYQEF